eukprot:1846158-Pleurochrysis_carterae.AAC.3
MLTASHLGLWSSETSRLCRARGAALRDAYGLRCTVTSPSSMNTRACAVGRPRTLARAMRCARTRCAAATSPARRSARPRRIRRASGRCLPRATT